MIVGEEKVASVGFVIGRALAGALDRPSCSSLVHRRFFVFVLALEHSKTSSLDGDCSLDGLIPTGAHVLPPQTISL